MSALERIRQEVREIVFVTVYFLGCFLLFLSLKKLLLEQYDIEISIFTTAVIGALVVAKVVVLLDKTSLGHQFRDQRLFVRILWRSFAYTAIVFGVTVAERLFHLYRESGELGSAAGKLWADKDFDHFLAMNISIGLSFLAYNVFSEIDRHMGEGTLCSLFLGKQPSGAPRRP